MPVSVEILKLGRVGQDVLNAVREGLEEAYQGLISAFVSDLELEVPREAYDGSRYQYNSGLVLAFLRRSCRPRGDKLLAVTHVDLFVPRLNFVFGQAECPGRFAIISTCRLRPEFYGEPPHEPLFLERCVKEAAHEIGHTLGLGHCPNRRCVMAFSNSIWDTDRKGTRPCESCMRELKLLLGLR
ncbi:MAG TPA: archemetzincin [Candidatus Bathyarchaeota archaeon]|nr:archemetzincin [Candidatus Bathyarchaeota archaeon]